MVQDEGPTFGTKQPGEDDEEPVDGRDVITESEDKEYDMALGVCEWGREVGRMVMNALPVYCFNVSQFANNILSQAFIGHLGAKELAASALAISYMNVMCQTINYGLATGQETVVSQANGARRYREVGLCLQRGLIVLLISQLLMSCVSYFGTQLLSSLGQDAELASMVRI